MKFNSNEFEEFTGLSNMFNPANGDIYYCSGFGTIEEMEWIKLKVNKKAQTVFMFKKYNGSSYRVGRRCEPKPRFKTNKPYPFGY